MSRGVLDRPVEPGDDSGEDVIQHFRGTICPSSASFVSLRNRRAHGRPALAAPAAWRAKWKTHHL